MKPHILTINGGSSSVKFALYQTDAGWQRVLSGKIDRIGLHGANLSFRDSHLQNSFSIEAANHSLAANFLLDWLAKEIDFSSVVAVGHRVVHGMSHIQPELVSRVFIDDMKRIVSYDPEHLPGEIELIEAFFHRYPQLPQVACFDTAFHYAMPRVAQLLPIPRRYESQGIRRYGFHGLSYAFMMQELARLGDPAASRGRIILAHLGNGASLVAVYNGQSIDTSMGFTPTSGLMMSTRTGDLDPGVARYLIQSEKLTPEQFNHLVNHESGLLGVSETSSDMRDLLINAATDERAVEAIELFCYQVKKYIGAYAAALGGLDTLVFSGGIGESAAVIRARVCAGLEFLDIDIDEKRNAGNDAVISSGHGRVVVRVIHTDEELMIAKSVCCTLRLSTGNEANGATDDFI